MLQVSLIYVGARMTVDVSKIFLGKMLESKYTNTLLKERKVGYAVLKLSVKCDSKTCI